MLIAMKSNTWVRGLGDLFAGEEYDVDAEVAESLIKAGYAQPASVKKSKAAAAATKEE